MDVTADPLSSAPSRQQPSRYWTAIAIVIALPTLLSLAAIAVSVLRPDPESMRHLVAYVLPGVTLNTLVLVAGVALLACALGVSLAWLTAVYDFPGRRLFTWALLLPMAMPAYVTGFVAIGLLDYTGPVQTLMREVFGAGAGLPPIRSRGGVILVMSLALYPYVYLLARNGFLTQGRQALEVAQSLGYGRRAGFFRVAVPLARPWIAGGTMLVVMETLADFGTVSVFNYDTFTIAIYRSWFSLFSISSALQLAFFLLLLVAAVLVAERVLRGRAGFATRQAPPAPPIVLQGAARWLASGYAALVVALGFAVPALQLGLWSLGHVAAEFDAHYLGYAARSLLLATTAALLVAAVALALAYSVRLAANRAARGAARVATLGYALPGAVLAVAIYSQLTYLNRGINALVAALHDGTPALFLQGTLLAMLLAYLVRFLAVAHQAVEAAMQRITPQIDEASRSLGVVGWRLLGKVHLPLLRGGLATALVLVFVDVMKEMPITLMTRPFGWDTLAVRVYEMTAEGRWEQAALPALTIAAVGLVPVLFITRTSAHAPATH